MSYLGCKSFGIFFSVVLGRFLLPGFSKTIRGETALHNILTLSATFCYLWQSEGNEMGKGEQALDPFLVFVGVEGIVSSKIVLRSPGTI